PPPAAPQGPYGMPAGPAGVPDCRMCGSVPAAPGTVRGHQGMFVLMRFLRTEGPLCRDCGLATYRRMQSDTLWQGWWGPLSLFITPVTLLMNLGPRAAYYRLQPPANGILRPLDPGKPLWRRPPALLVLAAVVLVSFALPTLIVIGLLAGGDGKPQPLATGQCVRNVGDWKEQKLLAVDCSSPDAQYRVHAAPCAGGDYIAALKYTPENGSLRCLRPLDRPTR
ncbi:LppU/SCO3897 family protein, partial [Streptomyces toxytricini]|uniref:LppU/SCO3897 family protein n=1 Tax=Streptomyces toxytricini TaxID=67369 RepID=UPI00341FE0AF